MPRSGTSYFQQFQIFNAGWGRDVIICGFCCKFVVRMVGKGLENSTDYYGKYRQQYNSQYFRGGDADLKAMSRGMALPASEAVPAPPDVDFSSARFDENGKPHKDTVLDADDIMKMVPKLRGTASSLTALSASYRWTR